MFFVAPMQAFPKGSSVAPQPLLRMKLSAASDDKGSVLWMVACHLKLCIVYIHAITYWVTFQPFDLSL